MKRIKLLFLVILCIIAFHSSAQGYSIKIKIKNLRDTNVILAHYLGKSIYPDDTIRLDKNGYGVFKGKEPLPGGMYIIYLPNRNFFDFLLDKNQEFSMENDTADFLTNIKITGSPENTKFYDYQRFIQSKRKDREAIAKEMEDTTISKAKREKIKARIAELNEEVDMYQKKIIKDNPGTFLATFLQSLMEVEVPDPPRKDDGTIDSAFQYFYYKKHFFDNFDYTDGRLLRTPLYESKVMQYITNVIPQIPDSINKELDVILTNSMKDKDVFRFNLIKFFNHYAKSNIMGMDAVYIHLAEKFYIPHADWSDSTFINKLKKHVQEAKPTLIGNIAPDIDLIWVPVDHFKAAANDTALKNYVHAGRRITLHQMNAPFIVLAFWEKDCGHCRKIIPELYKVYNDTLKSLGVQVIAFHMLFGVEGKQKWVDFVNEHQLYDWINVWNPYSYRFKELYDIKSTPVILLLDEDKKIVAKKIGPEHIKDIVLALNRQKKKKQQQ